METNFFTQFNDYIRKIVQEEIYLLNSTITKIKDTKLSSGVLENKNNLTSIQSKIGWLESLELLEFFHSLLYSYGFIVCDFEQFSYHFFGSKEVSIKILWKTSKVRLVLLFDLLYTYRFIPKCNHPHNLLKEHFTFKNSESSNINETLRSSLCNARNANNKNKSSYIIEEIIEKLVNKISK